MNALEVAIYRVGGKDGYPRQFGPMTVPVSTTGIDSFCLDACSSEHCYMRVQFSNWGRTDDEWLSCHVSLGDMNGYHIGRRPAEIFDRFYDFASQVHFSPHHPDAGAFVVSLRKVGG